MEIPRADGDAATAEVTLIVGGDPVVVTYDPEHLAAHAADFALTWSETVEAIAAALGESGSRTGIVHRGLMRPAVVGRTGIVTVGPGDPAFWGYRKGRTVPSHLIAGDKEETREMCVWGEWAAPDRFDLITCYPGAPAPREIHDPGIALDEIDEAIAFWAVHAIVVDPSEVGSTRTPEHR